MIRGERFEVDLDSDSEDDATASAPPLPGAFVHDVLERKPAAVNAPRPPTLKNKTGFPEHKKRTVESRFKQKRNSPSAEKTEPVEQTSPPTGDQSKPKSWVEEEKQKIDDENRQRLADMSPAQLEEERRNLLSSLSPMMIERLLKRSNIASGSNETDLAAEPVPPSSTIPSSKKSATKSVSFAEPELKPESTADLGTVDAVDDEVIIDTPEVELLPHDNVHFPRPQQPPDLDPASATFLNDLHEKYFPSLPADPDKLEWMQSSQVDNKAYDPSSAAFNASDIRFSFTGELIAPKTASLIPVTAGLHHHGDAPDAAGYTVAELAHLSRSTYAAQRCIAFQTLGRFLYRLGKGEFGNPGEPGEDVTGIEDSLGELARGLWHEVEQQKVIETLVMESEGMGVDQGRHISAKAYATEAVHLWRKGGGRRWKAS